MLLAAMRWPMQGTTISMVGWMPCRRPGRRSDGAADDAKADAQADAGAERHAWERRPCRSRPTLESCEKVRERTGPPPNVLSARFTSTGENILVDLDAASDHGGQARGRVLSVHRAPRLRRRRHGGVRLGGRDADLRRGQQRAQFRTGRERDAPSPNYDARVRRRPLRMSRAQRRVERGGGPPGPAAASNRSSRRPMRSPSARKAASRSTRRRRPARAAATGRDSCGP